MQPGESVGNEGLESVGKGTNCTKQLYSALVKSNETLSHWASEEKKRLLKNSLPCDDINSPGLRD